MVVVTVIVVEPGNVTVRKMHWNPPRKPTTLITFGKKYATNPDETSIKAVNETYQIYFGSFTPNDEKI